MDDDRVQSGDLEPSSAVPRRRRAEPESDADRQNTRRRLMIVLPAVMAVAALSVFVLEGLGDIGVKLKTVDRLLAEKQAFVGRDVKFEGSLVEGSLVKRETPCEYRFSVIKNGAAMPVTYPKCSDFPDMLQAAPDPDLERKVTMNGQLQADGTFLASSIMTQCPSKYDEEQMAKKGIKRPRGTGDNTMITPSAAMLR